MHLQITKYFRNTRLPNKLLTDTIIHIYNNEYLQCGDSSHPGESQLTDDLNSCKKNEVRDGKKVLSRSWYMTNDLEEIEISVGRGDPRPRAARFADLTSFIVYLSVYSFSSFKHIKKKVLRCGKGFVPRCSWTDLKSVNTTFIAVLGYVKCDFRFTLKHKKT